MSGTKKSAKHLFVGSLFSKAISFVGTIFLARILYPEDFGYLLSAMIIAGFIQMFGNVGFENFYLQEKTTSKEQEEKILHITFKLRMLVNLALFVLQWIISYITEIYYSPIVGQMLRVFSFNIVLMIPVQINMYVLRKKLNYKPEVYANVSRDIISTIMKLIFAMSGFGALSFAIGAVIGNIARTLVILRFQSFLPDFSIKDKQIFEKIFFFGKHSFIGGIATYFTNQIDKILLGSFFPASIVGYYYFAESQSKTVFTYFLAPQSSLILSYSAKYKDNPKYLFNVLKNIGYLIGIFTLPVVVYLSFYSNEIFHIVFGQKWDQSIYIFKCFLIYYFITELTFPFSPLLTAFGLPSVAAKLVSIRFVVLAIALSTTIMITNNILYYLYVFIFISFIFSWIKLYIGLNIMKQSSYEYLLFLKNLIPITFVYVGVLYLIDSLSIDLSYKLIFGLVCIIISSLVIHIVFLKKQFRSALSFILSSSNKFLQRLN